MSFITVFHIVHLEPLCYRSVVVFKHDEKQALAIQPCFSVCVVAPVVVTETVFQSQNSVLPSASNVTGLVFVYWFAWTNPFAGRAFC